MPRKENSYGLLSIRNRILIFSLLVTLLPSLTMGLLLHKMLYSTLEEKVEQKLVDSADIFERELSLWFKERVYDLNVFSNSSIISDGVAEYIKRRPHTEDSAVEPTTQLQTLETYLATLQNQFEDYARILILTKDGSVVAASLPIEEDSSFFVPEDVIDQVADRHWFQGEVYFDKIKSEPLMLIGIPLFINDLYDYEVMLALEIRLSGLMPLLTASQLDNSDESVIHKSIVVLKDRRHFLSNMGNRSFVTGAELAFRQLFNGDQKSIGVEEFVTENGQQLMGMLVQYEKFGWGLFLAKDYNKVFAEAIHSRNQNLIIVALLAVLIGIAAYFLARQITRPLSFLTQGARKVAEGDLEVQLHVRGNDEIGFTISVFNEMVTRLKESQIKLEQLATTDSLTGLSNRKQIMNSLHHLFEYYQRYKTEFSVLMLDVDHFKSINDTHGHQAGDAVLKEIASIFRENLRNVDLAGRYGGEEFLVVLPESAEDESLQVANRMRLAVANHLFSYDDEIIRIHISIGVSRVMMLDENVECIIKRADKGLYKAKRSGRNQVVYLIPDDEVKPGMPEKVISLRH